jgi:hypothetical protein
MGSVPEDVVATAEVLFRSKLPDIEIPQDLTLQAYCFERLPEVGALHHRREHGRRAHLRRRGAALPEGGGGPARAGRGEGRRGDEPAPQLPRVRFRLPRRGGAGRRHHHGQPVLHAARDPPPGGRRGGRR